MKNFLSKKKAAPEPLTLNNTSFDALLASMPPEDSPPLRKSTTSRWRKGKKQPEIITPLNPVKPLPSIDDFRQSLLMPAFTARFSLLKEQYDPNSLLGKASDDSVLQPRRQSRMGFGHAYRGLGDIPEDSSSIDSSVRPPFASGRQDSYTSEEGYHSELDSAQAGSVMLRARPGEGNNLFGGRQKVYMIQKSSVSATKGVGRAVYEDDIGTSAFQKYRREQQQAQERKISDERQGFDFGLDDTTTDDQDDCGSLPNDSAKDLSHSPSLNSSFEKTRSTNSTSHSEARSSTAATSVTSQPATSAPSPAMAMSQPAPGSMSPTMQAMKRHDTKARRLYEQGLDQHMHEQQTSAMSRLNSIQRHRALSNKQPPPLQSVKSTGNLHEKARRPVYAVRGQSPPPAALPLKTSFSSTRLQGSNNPSPIASGPVSPVSPHDVTDFDEFNALSQALEPGDRGKATAMGAFNKPKQCFDEEQYIERQRQLQRSASAVKNIPDVQSKGLQRLGRFEQERERSDSNASARSRSPRQQDPSKAFNVFKRAANRNAQPGAQQVDKSALPDTHRTFFGNISASDSEDEDEDRALRNRRPLHMPDYGFGNNTGRWQPTLLPVVSEHPALRAPMSEATLAEEDEDEESKSPRSSQPSRSLPLDASPTTLNKEKAVEPPSLGGRAAAPPLNNLMYHLRQSSNVSDDRSSINRASTVDGRAVPDLNTQNLDLGNQPARSTMDAESRMGSTYASSNPWDLDDAEKSNHVSRASISPIESGQPSGRFDAAAPSMSSRISAVSDLEPDHKTSGSWPDEPRTQHTRDTSTATQQAREDFDKELAARRAAIQENMKTVVARENQSRDGSPAPSASGPFKAFGMLRSRPSRESVETGRSTPSQGAAKALKILGVNANGTSTNSPIERSGQSFEFGRPREDSVSRPPLPTSTSAMQQTRSRENSEVGGRDGVPPTTRSMTTPVGGRSRANSEAPSGRARSRTGPYRDDLEKAMVEGTGSSAAVPEYAPPMMPSEPTPRPSPDLSESGRARSNSRAAMGAYFDSKQSQQPMQTNSKDRMTPGNSSPFTLPPNVYSPGFNSGRPSPLPSPYAQNVTPPLSGSSTPLSSTFTPFAPPQQAWHSPPSGRPGGILQKKAVSKRDISEPVLVSSTSNIDTVDLPEGASLKNGIDEAPPVPPINPRRRTAKSIFRLGRTESEESTSSIQSRSKTPDVSFSKFQDPEAQYSRSRTDPLSPRKPPAMHTFDQSPATTPRAFAHGPPSPERVQRMERVERMPASPARAIPVEGGMF